MVRIGSLHDQMLLDKDSRENKTHMTPGEQIDAALDQVRSLCRRRDAAYTALMGLLEEQGVTIVDFHSIRPESEKYLETMFRREFLPLLSTFIIGKSSPSLSGQQGHLRHCRAEHQDRERRSALCPASAACSPADPRARAHRLLHSGRGADPALPAHDVPPGTRSPAKHWRG